MICIKNLFRCCRFQMQILKSSYLPITCQQTSQRPDVIFLNIYKSGFGKWPLSGKQWKGHLTFFHLLFANSILSGIVLPAVFHIYDKESFYYVSSRCTQSLRQTYLWDTKAHSLKSQDYLQFPLDYTFKTNPNILPQNAFRDSKLALQIT